MALSCALGSPDSRNHRGSINATNEPVRVVLLQIGRIYGVSIAIANDVHGYVTIDLRNVSLAQAMAAVSEAAHVQFQTRHDIIIVGDAPSAPGQAAISGPTVLPLSILEASHAAAVLRTLFPGIPIRADRSANAIIVTASDLDAAAIRTVLQGLDVRDASRPTVDSLSLRVMNANDLQVRLAPLYPNAKFSTVGKNGLIIRAAPVDMAQIKAIASTLDTPAPISTPAVPASDAVTVMQRQPRDVARAVSHQIRDVKASVSGSAVILIGPTDSVMRAKALIAAIDVPPFGAEIPVVYHLHNIDATSVANLIERSYSDATVNVDASLNAISVTATSAEQSRINDAIGRLDGSSAPGGQPYDPGMAGTEFVPLKSVTPSQPTGSSSTTAQDIANTVTQVLQYLGDLKIVVPNNAQQLIVSGSPSSIKRAKELIEKLDVVPPSVVLDTEILELDQTGSKNLGLQLSTGISSTFNEITPPNDPVTGLAGRISSLQAITRTPISFQATINLLLQSGNARVLANPRITTISGRTASIRAGDTLSILTTTGGGTGTVATTQLQSFQTGVQIDITPVVAANGDVMVALHPVVNSLTAYNNGVPQISTRDAQTTVHLQDNETLVIGGLIQDSIQRTTNKIPVLGDLPLVGGAFRNDQVDSTRNELVIVVTPHIVTSTSDSIMPGPPLPKAPSPEPLPTVPPGTLLPPFQYQGTTPTLPPSTKHAARANPVASASPSPAPAPTPSAFASMNAFTYGSPPPNNSANPGDGPIIYYAQYQPTVVHVGDNVNVAVITSTNVQRVAIGPPGFLMNATQVGAGKWTLSYPFSGQGFPAGQTSLSVPIIAFRGDGLSTTVNVTVNVLP